MSISLSEAGPSEYMVTCGDRDIDIWVGTDEGNLDRLLEALFSFGVPAGVTKDFFQDAGGVFRMGNPPMRIEIITEATGVVFSECHSRKIEIPVENLSIPFISYADFVRNKRSSGRLKDLADLESLGEDPERHEV